MKTSNNIPAYRFQGYTDAWELRRFSELAEIRRGLTYSPTSIRKEGIRVLRSSNIDEDTFTFGEDDVFVDKWVLKIPLVKEGDILITAANGSSRLVGKHAIIKYLPANSAIHGGFMLLASCRNPEFVNSLMSSAWYTKFINLYVAGGNGAIGNLNKNDLDEQNVLVPNPKEQSAIGTFFSTLDQQITLHQRKLDTLKEQKKTYLKLLFPAKGQTQPSLRFQGFEDDWEEVKLGDISKMYQPQTITGSELTDEGVPVFGANGYIGYYSDSNHVTDQVTISARGEGTGTPNFVKAPVWITGNSMVINVDENKNIDKKFLYANFLAFDFKKYVSGGAQPQLTRDVLSLVKISLPSLPEQEAIGSFFQTLDQEISQVEDKLASLKEMKKTLLRKLFA